MKNIVIISAVILMICILEITGYSQTYRSVNFEGAGWVTAVKYSSDGTRLYARTDVGGVFRSDDGGNNWQFISGYAETHAGLYIQGLAIHPVNKDIVYIACGTSYRTSDPGRGIWKTTDGGVTWSHILSTINFSGNDNIRWGGECILLDPVNPNIIYCGGRESGIYKSTDNGSTWNLLAANSVISGNISSISLKQATSGNTAELWVGSSEGSSPAGIWRSTNAGTSWLQMRNSAQVQGLVFKILVKTDGTVFAAYNESLAKYSSGIWSDVTGFGTGQGNFAAVHFMGSENKIIAGRMDYTRVSNDGGLTFPVVLPMTLTGPLPKHSFNWNTVEWARNHFMQNPANANEWFMSGGFGCIKSTDAGQIWRYSTRGINIPVMYKTYFHLSNPNIIYLPMGDLTMGRITNGGTDGELSDYAFYSFNILQDFSNATAVLTTQANLNKHYIAGGNIYQGETPGVFITSNNGANYTRLSAAGIPNTAERPIVGGVASNTNENQLIVFVGGNYSDIGTVGGVYWSSNGGNNFTRANGLSANIMAPGVFYSSYMLGKDPVNTMKRYGYFEGNGGGFYESIDEGRNWSLKNQVIAGYKNPGTLVIHPTVQNLFYTAIADKGLYKTTDGGTSWNNFSGWESAEQVDAVGNIITAFGRRTGDSFNKIYKSTTSGGLWEEITGPSRRLPNTTSLTINPYNTNQLWIGTTGNGTFIYDGLTIGINIISTGVPKQYSLSQNYPNPFNPVTNIKFDLPKSGNVKLVVFDVLGKEAAVLVDKALQPGSYSYDWEASGLPSGVYFYRLSTGSFSEVKKMLLVK
jgi:xyloglucan-specific exo-beta-1,4-glucanase